jgi:PAS domain S-box-containing protein
MESSHNSAHQDIEHKLEHAESKISQLQAELTHTQSIYQSMIEHIPACVAIFKAVEGGTDFVFTEFNKAAEGFEKISKSALLGKKVTEVFKGVEEFGILKVFQGVWKSGEPAIYPSKIYSIEKFEGYRENYIFKLPSDEIVAIYQDKTKEPQILNGVEKSSKLLKKFPEENPNPVLQFDVNGNLLYSNKASAELLKAWGLHDNRIQSAKIQNLICSGEPTQEILSIDQDGSKKFFSVTFSPLKNSEFVNIYAYDITDRELAIEKRILSEQRFTKLFKHMLDGSALHKIVLDATGHPIDYVYVDINPAFTKMVGLTREMAIGKKVSEVIPGVLEDSTNLIQKFGNVALNNETISYEINFEPLQKSFAVTAYCPEKEYFVTVFRDITLKQKLEKEQENLIYTLNKRMKELQCLFKFSEISEHNNNIEESLAAFLVEIPKAWQYPSSTYAKIVFREQSYTTPNYQSTPWMQKEDIIIYGKKLGQIEVGYLEKKSDEDEGPFFTEERDLVKMLAERISRSLNDVRQKLKLKL